MLMPLTVYLYQRDRQHRLARLRRRAHARRARHRLAHGGADADGPAGHASCGSSATRWCACCRCCSCCWSSSRSRCPARSARSRAILQPELPDPGAVAGHGHRQRPDRGPRPEPRGVGADAVPRAGLRHAGTSHRSSAPRDRPGRRSGGAQILDNQWLGTLLEIGAVGVLGAAVAVLPRRSAGSRGGRARTRAPTAGSRPRWPRRCRRTRSGMFTFDAFAFIQVTFLAFIMLGFAAVVARAGTQR